MAPYKIARLLPDFCQTYFLQNAEFAIIVSTITTPNFPLTYINLYYLLNLTRICSLLLVQAIMAVLIWFESLK